MYSILLAISYFFSGFFMKYSDDEYDEKNNLNKAIIFGIISGFFSGIASILSIDASYIFIGILIGNLLVFKVDGIHHIATLITFLILYILFGTTNLNMVILLICIFSALLDEVGHEIIDNFTLNKLINIFFKYRFSMKLIIFLLAIFGVFDIFSFLFFMLFELSYEFVGYLFN